MKKQFELTYHKVGDYSLPDLGIIDHRPFGRWGMLYIKYLEEHHPISTRACCSPARWRASFPI